jgi:quercetin dioxygenase-like cupin family protein
MDEDARPLTFIDAPLPPGFERRTIVYAPGAEVPFDEEDWRGVLVVVRQGELELERRAGGRRRFGPGSILWAEGLALRWLRNPGIAPTVLVAVSRRARPAP